jgi:cell division protein ZipA
MPRSLAVAILLAAVGMAALLWARAQRDASAASALPPRPTLRVGDEEIYLAPSSESRPRADAVLPRGPSEDARHVLGTVAVPRDNDDPDVDFVPNDVVAWVVHVTFEGDPPLPSAFVMKGIQRELKPYYDGLSIHGYDPAQRRWTYVTPQEPAAVTKLQLAWLYEPIDEDEPLATLGAFRDRLRRVTSAVSPLGNASVTAPVSPEEAVKRAEVLRDVHRRLDRPASLLLAAPDGRRFEGRKVWDVLSSLGLEWGDMDCFHWKNEGGIGDDAFFSVSTSTSPGYFLPEDVIAGRVHVEDLIFQFSIPRTHHPVAVFDAMTRAAAYAQKRLGGTLYDEDGDPAKLDAVRASVDRAARELTAAGFVPGSDSALRLF